MTRKWFAAGLAGLSAMIGLAVNVFDLRGHLFPASNLNYEGEIYFTYVGNKDFVDFLNKQVGDVVLFKAEIVADLSVGENEIIYDTCGGAELYGDEVNSGVLDGYITSRRIPLPFRANTKNGEIKSSEDIECLSTAIEIRSKKSRFDTSHGGTGVVRIPFNGRYLIERVL
jgi:hypothetical protein